MKKTFGKRLLSGITSALLAITYVVPSATDFSNMLASAAGDNPKLTTLDGNNETDAVTLLVGKENALLIDTGLGVSDISKEVLKITNKPVIAVPTHVHWDHIGGLWNFSEFYVHESEKDWIEENFPLSNEFVRKMLVKGNNLTERTNVDDYAVFQGNPKKILIDGDIIDLGNRKIKVLHTPGHSPGHMCFFEEKTGYLFSGDLIYKGTLFANYESTDPEKYLESVITAWKFRRR